VYHTQPTKNLNPDRAAKNLNSINQPFACFVFVCTLTASILWASEALGSETCQRGSSTENRCWPLVGVGVGWTRDRLGPYRWPLCVRSPNRPSLALGADGPMNSAAPVLEVGHQRRQVR
jgi:hypothetical protein